jgi:AhpD family alkylhydroperoxidase
VAHVTQCPFCITGHTKLAGRKGASPAEIMEATWVAAEMRAGGAFAHATLAINAMDRDGSHRHTTAESEKRWTPTVLKQEQHWWSNDLHYGIYRLDAFDTAGRLPYSLEVLLAMVDRNGAATPVPVRRAAHPAVESGAGEPRRRCRRDGTGEEVYSISGLTANGASGPVPHQVKMRAEIG